MPLYGFKVNNQKDQLAITNLLMQSNNIQTKDYTAYAQYQITDVALKPRDVRPSQPRRWSLGVNTSLLGFNDPNGQALWFDTDSDNALGDGYITYDLPANEFANMIKAGLYVNPEEYVEKLKQDLKKQTFYRQSKVHLMQFILPDNHLQIAVGDLRMKQDTGRIYYVGRDLQNYCQLDSSVQSDFQNVLNKSLDKLSKNPISVSLEETRAKSQEVQQQVDVPDLPTVSINSEIDLSSTANPEVSEVGSSVVDSVVDSNMQAVDSNLVESSTPSSASVLNFNDLMRQLNLQRASAEHIRGAQRQTHAYVDDFADALANSNETNSQRSQVRRRQRVEDNSINTVNNNQNNITSSKSSVDDGLER